MPPKVAWNLNGFLHTLCTLLLNTALGSIVCRRKQLRTHLLCYTMFLFVACGHFLWTNALQCCVGSSVWLWCCWTPLRFKLSAGLRGQLLCLLAEKKDCRQLCKSLACLVEDVFAHLSVVDMLETDSDTLHLHAWSHSLDLAKCSIRGIILSTQNCTQAGSCSQGGLGHINKHNSESSTLRTTSRVLIRK